MTKKCALTVGELRWLAGIAALRGTTDAFIRLALEWADRASEEVARLRARVSELESSAEEWRPTEIAPKDGTLLLLLVTPDDHATEDAAMCRTIGHNNRDNDGEDIWQFAGWCWEQDCFTEGTGKVLGWLPVPPPPGVG